MYACRSVSVACRPAEKRRRRGEIGSIHRSILVGHRRPNRRQRVNERRAKYNYEKKLADNAKFDAKSFYAYVRSRSNSRAGIGVLSRDDGERVESPEEVAEEFNDYFSSVFSVEEMGSVPGAERGTVGAIWLYVVRRFEFC